MITEANIASKRVKLQKNDETREKQGLHRAFVEKSIISMVTVSGFKKKKNNEKKLISHNKHIVL